MAAPIKILLPKNPVMQESFLKKFQKKEDWEQTLILSALQRLVAMMDATAVSGAPFLSAAPLEIVVDNQKGKTRTEEKA